LITFERYSRLVNECLVNSYIVHAAISMVGFGLSASARL
jgi:hypothetical protein